jgi:hypothetical protein
MAQAVWIEFGAGVDQQVYDDVNGRVNPPGDPPSGLIFHSAGPSPDGGWRVVDVWDSRATFDRFFEERVQPPIREPIGEEALSQGSPPDRGLAGSQLQRGSRPGLTRPRPRAPPASA